MTKGPSYTETVARNYEARRVYRIKKLALRGADPDGEALKFERHVLDVPLAAIYAATKGLPLETLTGADRERFAPFLGRIARVERFRSGELRGAYRVAMRQLPADVCAALARRAKRKPLASVQETQEIMRARVLRFKVGASVVIYDAGDSSEEPAFYKLESSPAIDELVRAFGGERRLTLLMLEPIVKNYASKLVRGIELDQQMRTAMVGLTAQTNRGRSKTQVRTAGWTIAPRGRAWVQRVGRLIATAIYKAIRCIPGVRVDSALAELSALISDERERPLGPLAALSMEVAAGVQALLHHDAGNKFDHPSAYLVAQSEDSRGRRPVGGNLVIANFGALLDAGALAVVGADFLRFPHVSAPAGIDPRGATPGRPGGKDVPLRAIAIVFSHRLAVKRWHEGRFLDRSCRVESTGRPCKDCAKLLAVERAELLKRVREGEAREPSARVAKSEERGRLAARVAKRRAAGEARRLATQGEREAAAAAAAEAEDDESEEVDDEEGEGEEGEEVVEEAEEAGVAARVKQQLRR